MRKLWRLLWRTHEAYGDAVAAMHEGIALSQIRAHLAALGIPTEHLTDDELAAKIIDFGRAVVGAGLKWEEAADIMTVGCHVVRMAGEPAAEWLSKR